MTPLWDLRLGDCLDPVTGMASLVDKSVDHVITDPPYEAEAHALGRRQKPAGWRTKIGPCIEVKPIDFVAMDDASRRAVATEAARLSPGRALVFCQIEAVAKWASAFDATGMEYRRSIPWTKPDAMPSLHGRWPGQAFETIVLAQHGSSSRCPVGGKAVYYDIPKVSGSGDHPTAKPLPLMLKLIRDFTDPGDLILDPFAGSGTTGVAAIRLGRRFIGWEKSPAYHAIALKRLTAAREQLELIA